MQVNRLLTEDDAVSPVIGVILVVAITIVLAAVAGTLLFDMGQPPSTTPTVWFTFDMNDRGDGWSGAGDYVNVTHESGPTLDHENVGVRVGSEAVPFSAADWASDIGAGDELALTDGGDASAVPVGGGIDEGEMVRVVWTDPDGTDSFVIGESEVG